MNGLIAFMAGAGVGCISLALLRGAVFALDPQRIAKALWLVLGGGLLRLALVVALLFVAMKHSLPAALWATGGMAAAYLVVLGGQGRAMGRRSLRGIGQRNG